MSFYSLAQRTTANTTNAPSWEIRAASVNSPKIVELGFTQATAASGTYGLGRPGSIGLTPTSPQTFVSEADAGAPAANTTAAVAWGTAPTSPTFFDRRASVAAAIGSGTMWVFPRGIYIAQGSSLVLWSIGAAAAQDVWAVIDE